MLLLRCCSNRNEPQYTVLSAGVAISKEFAGKKLYYKYLLFRSVQMEYDTPMELIYMAKKPQPDEDNFCFRVLNFSSSFLDVAERDIFDSCIYPYALEQKRSVTGWVTKWVFGESLEPLDLSNEQDHCINAHLQEEYKQIETCEVNNIDEVCRKITSVYKCFSTAKKVNVNQNITKEFDFYPLTSTTSQV